LHEEGVLPGGNPAEGEAAFLPHLAGADGALLPLDLDVDVAKRPSGGVQDPPGDARSPVEFEDQGLSNVEAILVLPDEPGVGAGAILGLPLFFLALPFNERQEEGPGGEKAREGEEATESSRQEEP